MAAGTEFTKVTCMSKVTEMIMSEYMVNFSVFKTFIYPGSFSGRHTVHAWKLPSATTMLSAAQWTWAKHPRAVGGLKCFAQRSIKRGNVGRASTALLLFPPTFVLLIILSSHKLRIYVLKRFMKANKKPTVVTLLNLLQLTIATFSTGKTYYVLWYLSFFLSGPFPLPVLLAITDHAVYSKQLQWNCYRLNQRAIVIKCKKTHMIWYVACICQNRNKNMFTPELEITECGVKTGRNNLV